MATSSPKPLRSDARRNREKIVVAARDAFAEAGIPAQMEDIAARAGVGVGTLYRHFPTKEAILSELIVEHMSTFAALGREALADEDRDPWEAFSAWMWRCAEHHEADRALCQVLANKPAEIAQAAAEQSGLLEVTDELIRRAQGTGAMRPDAATQDVPLVMCGVGAVLQSTWGEGAWKRYLTIALDGLRAPGSGPLPPLG